MFVHDGSCLVWGIGLAIRTALGLHAGTKLDFELDQDSLKVVPLRASTLTLSPGAGVQHDRDL